MWMVLGRRLTGHQHTRQVVSGSAFTAIIGASLHKTVASKSLNYTVINQEVSFSYYPHWLT